MPTPPAKCPVEEDHDRAVKAAAGSRARYCAAARMPIWPFSSIPLVPSVWVCRTVSSSDRPGMKPIDVVRHVLHGRLEQHVAGAPLMASALSAPAGAVDPEAGDGAEHAVVGRVLPRPVARQVGPDPDRAGGACRDQGVDHGAEVNHGRM